MPRSHRNQWWYIYIYTLSSTDWLFWCIRTLRFLDMWDALSWDRKPPNFTSGWLHNPRLNLRFNVGSEIKAYISNLVCLPFALAGCRRTFIRRPWHYVSGNRYIPSPECSIPPHGRSAYSDLCCITTLQCG